MECGSLLPLSWAMKAGASSRTPEGGAGGLTDRSRRSRVFCTDKMSLYVDAVSHKESALITSPPLRVPSAFHVARPMEALTNRTDPSRISTLAPPGCDELEPMNESTLPNAALTAHAGWSGGIT